MHTDRVFTPEYIKELLVKAIIKEVLGRESGTETSQLCVVVLVPQKVVPRGIEPYKVPISPDPYELCIYSHGTGDPERAEALKKTALRKAYQCYQDRSTDGYPPPSLLFGDDTTFGGAVKEFNSVCACSGATQPTDVRIARTILSTIIKSAEITLQKWTGGLPYELQRFVPF